MFIRLYFVIIVAVVLIEIEGKPASKVSLSNRINYLLNITESEKKFNNILETYITSDSILSIYKSEINSFINKFLSFKSLRSHIVAIYRDLYTLSDINGMIQFYLSPLGKKILEREAKAEIRLAELIKSKLHEQMPQIVAWFQQILNKNISNDQLNQTIYSIN